MTAPKGFDPVDLSELDWAEVDQLYTGDAHVRRGVPGCPLVVRGPANCPRLVGHGDRGRADLGEDGGAVAGHDRLRPAVLPRRSPRRMSAPTKARRVSRADRRENLTITDFFCGAGGSSIGATRAGYEVQIAANHWDVAIATHSLNFPDTEHEQADISQLVPSRYRTTLVLWASPECTNHSQAKGKRKDTQAEARSLFDDEKPADRDSEVRSRATMWDVPRFAEYHLYRYVVVENVVEVTQWVMWPAWLQSMTLLGYDHEIVSLNSMHAPSQGGPRAPQSRDRVYIVFWRRGETRPDVTPRPVAWCEPCGREVRAVQVFKAGRKVGKYRAQYIYRCPRVECRNSIVEPFAAPASEAIDWHVRGQRIGDRATPLSAKTMARIKAGLAKYARPMTFEARGNTFVRTGPDGTPRYARAWPVDTPTATLHTSESRALVVPSGGTWREEATSTGEPMPARTTVETDGLLVPVEGRDGKAAVHTSAPIRTLTARAETALVVPYRRTGLARSATEPMPTLTTVDPAGVAFIAELRGGSSDHRPITEPLASVCAGGTHHGLVTSRAERTLIHRHNEGGAEMLTPATEPARTVTTKGHQSLLEWPDEIEVSIPDADDCEFRMLTVDELGRAMAFGSTADYALAGSSKRDNVRLLGNGVTPPAAEFLLTAIRQAAGV